MCHRARLAEQQFCWLASQFGSPLYLEQFLTNGFHSLSRDLKRRASGLSCWGGIQDLERSLGRFLGQPDELPIHFFGESADMIRLAGDLLFARPNRILTTDLCWLPYLHWLSGRASQCLGEVHVAALNHLVTCDFSSSDEIAEYLKREYERKRCNGLFLSDISYLGVRLPIAKLLSEIEPEYVVIDGAQAIHHRQVDLTELPCDLYLAGTQKWLHAYQPLRCAVVARKQHAVAINRIVASLRMGHQVDALFQFCERLKSAELLPFGSTVNVSPLICAAGALHQAHQELERSHRIWDIPIANTRLFANWMEDSPWRPLRLHPTLSSGIIRLIPTLQSSRMPGLLIRRVLTRLGIVATAYEDGTLRFSMPKSHLSLQQLSEILRALIHVSIEACK